MCRDMSGPRAFVTGWPVEHSRSPLIHGTWLRELGLEGSYEKIAVPPANFPAFVAGLREAGFAGGNVTIPHKETAAALCARLTPAAQRLGSVNTLWFDQGVLTGDSTDGAGFLAALDQEVPGWDQRCRDLAVVLGAGGAARAVADALLTRGFARIMIANRTLARADALVRQIRDARCEASGFHGAQAALPRAGLLVNTTAAGMKGQPELDFPVDDLPEYAVVNDIVYVPRVTPLLRAAANRDLRYAGGLGMLLHQAAPGFERWFGVRPQVTDALRAIVEADIEAAR